MLPILSSMEKPIHSFFSLMNAKGIALPRVPAVRTPVRLIFSRTGPAAPSNSRTDSQTAAHRLIAGPLLAYFGMDCMIM
jgi:hypothetical protein